MKKIISILFSRIDTPQFNIVRTIIFNFINLPFKQAVKLPIFLYGKVRFCALEGKINIEGPINTKMVKIGTYRGILGRYSRSTSIALFKDGIITFKGNTDIVTGTLLRVNGNLSIGRNVIIGADCNIICDDKIEIEDEARIAFQTRIMDTNFHPLINLTTKEIAPIKKSVLIGYKNWIGSCSHIMPGARMKPFTIVTSNSLVNKDFTEKSENNMILAGCPAKVIKSEFYRINSSEVEMEINDHYNGGTTDIYIYEKEIVVK